MANPYSGRNLIDVDQFNGNSIVFASVWLGYEEMTLSEPMRYEVKSSECF